MRILGVWLEAVEILVSADRAWSWGILCPLLLFVAEEMEEVEVCL